MGRTALLVRSEGRIVGDTWSADSNFPLPAQDRRLERLMRDAGYVYTYLAYVAPEARARGAFPLLLQRQLEMAQAAGKRGLFGSVLPTSDASRGSLVRTGFRPFGNLSVVQCGDRHFGRFRQTADVG
jgi:L-amino acid N-acyltransferase YncA